MSLRRVKITGGARTTVFPWGTVPRGRERLVSLTDEQYAIAQSTLDRGLIAALEDVKDVPAKKPAAQAPKAPEPQPDPEPAEEPAEDTTEVSADEDEEIVADAPNPLADLYEAVIGKPLTKEEPNRTELRSMYESVFGEDPGRKRSSTIIKELVDATAG